jgi:hypothetical protein
VSILVGLLVWCVASVPVGLVVGRVLRGRDHDPERCEWCRQENGEDW